MRRISEAREQVEIWRAIETQARDLADLHALAESEGDDHVGREVAREADALAARLEDMELELALSASTTVATPSSRFTRARAALTPGLGRMLLRMYLRWCDKRGFKATVLDRMPGRRPANARRGRGATPAATSAPSVASTASCASLLHSSSRAASFAKIECRGGGNDAEVNIDRTTCASTFSAPRGGRTFENSTAVILIPSGIVVSCQNGAPGRNRESAMKVLGRLLEIEIERQDASVPPGENITLAGVTRSGRTYFIAKMVKDHH
jgi:peptide chain release factor 2